MNPRAPTRSLLGSAAGTLLLLSAGCSKGEYRPREVANAAFDFAAEHARADTWAEFGVLRITSFASRAHLARGWSFPESSPASAYPGVWARSARPALRFWVVEPGPRSLSFEVLAGQGKVPRPPNRATATLNGAPAGEFLIQPGRTPIVLALPAEAQRPGLNELALEIQGGLRPSVDFENNEDSRWLTGYFSDLTVHVHDPGSRERVRQRARLVRRGARVVAGGQMIEQASGSVVRHALELPNAAVFESDILCGEGAVEVRFRVRLRDDEGTDVLVLDEVVEEGEARLVRADLGAYRGRVVELELALESASDPRAPVRGSWGRPVLLAEPAAPEPSAPEVEAALRHARAELARAPVIVMLLDAFNPDYMSAYGGRAGLTPNLDRLAGEGKRFERAFSAAAYTIAAVASILTSTPTWVHGTWNDATRLPGSIETWAERFARAGYRTAAVVCSGNGSSAFGFERGFERFVEAFRGLPGGRSFALAEEVVARVDEVLAADDGRPLMLWLHLLEPHEPYGARERWGTPLDPDYAGSIRGDTRTIVDIRSWRVVPSTRDEQHLRAKYEEGVAYGDHLVGLLRERLEARGLWQDAVVVMLSDHGEALFAHRSDEYMGLGHNTSTFNDMTRVPLIVRLPAGAGLDPAPCATPVGNIDVLATLADLVGVPLAGTRGTSFAPLLFGAGRGGSERLVVHSSSFQADRWAPDMAVVHGTFKYVYSTRWGEALYDLSRGLFESEDLLQQKPVLAAMLRQELRRELGFDFMTGKVQAPAGQSARLDDETRRQLEALGYGGEEETGRRPKRQQ